MADLTDFGMDAPTTKGSTTGEHFNPRDCRAITESKGEQCGHGAANSVGLCTTHQNAHGVRRVDEFETGPDPEFRDELIQECEFSGGRAYALATVFDDVHELWAHITTEHTLELGDEVLDHDTLVSIGPKVAMHPDLDVDDHLYAQDTCIALTQKGERCPNGGYGADRICGMHSDVDDLTVMEEFEDQVDL